MGNQPGKDLSGSDRPIITPDGQAISPHPDYASPYGQVREQSPSTGTYYSVASSGSPLVAPSSEMTWSTPPSTPQLIHVPAETIQSHSSSEVPRSQFSHGYDPTNQKHGVYNLNAAAAVGRPGSAGLPSDSSGMSSRRRRFRVREQELLEENASSVSVRPGKKDKSQSRKSTLNQPGPDGLDHRPVDSDLSSSSTDAQSRLRGTPLSLGSQDGMVPTSTGLPGRTAKFPVGKGNKKDKSSAIEALITQTAMFAPRLAHTKVPSDNRGFKPRDGTVLTSGAESDAISVHSKTGECAPIPEPQTPPPMDPTTKVKAVTPVYVPRHDIPSSVPYGQSPSVHPASLDRRSVSAQDHITPHDQRGAMTSPHDQRGAMTSPHSAVQARAFSPTIGHPVSGKMSPPPGVPMMGSQMIRKQPFSPQGGSVSSQQPSLIRTSGSLSSLSSIPAATRSVSAATRSVSQVSSASALPQSGVVMTTQSGTRAVTTPSTVAMASTSSVVTMATAQTPTVVTAAMSTMSGVPASVTKDTLSRPIASPKLVKTTRLKPLSETMQGTQSSPDKGQGQMSPQQPVSSGTLVYQGSRQETHQTKFPHSQSQRRHQQQQQLQQQLQQQQKQEKKQQQQQQPQAVPLISDQQHQGVETVSLTKPQMDVLKTSQTQKQLPSQQQHQEVETVKVSKQAQIAPTTPATAQAASSSGLQQKGKQKAEKPEDDKAKVKAGQLASATKQQPTKPSEAEKSQGQIVETSTTRGGKPASTTSTPGKPAASTQKEPVVASLKQQSTEKPAAPAQPKVPQPQHKAPQLPSKQKSVPGRGSLSGPVRGSFVKQKAVVSEVEPYPIAQASSPPLVKAEPKVIVSKSAKTKSLVKESASPTKSQKSESTSRKSGVLSKDQETNSVMCTDKKVDVEAKGKVQGMGKDTSVSSGDIVQVKSGSTNKDLVKESASRVQPKDVKVLPAVEPLYSTELKRSASVPIQKRGVLRVQVSNPEIKETKLITMVQSTQNSDYSSQSEREFVTPPTTPSDSQTDLADHQGELVTVADQTEPKPVIVASNVDSDSKKKQAHVDHKIKFDDKLGPGDKSASCVDKAKSSKTEAAEQKRSKPMSSEPKSSEPKPTESSKSSKPMSSEPKSSEPKSSEPKPTESSKSSETKLSESKSSEPKPSEPQSGPSEPRPSESEPILEEESLISSDAPVTDKIAAWQKHLTQPSVPQTQTHQKVVLRERRGLGVWSSGDSIPEQVSMLTPITEEQKSEKSDSRTEVSGGSADEAADQVSVAQRIFQMENKNDEDRFTLTRPTSGFTTPRLKVLRPLGSPLKGSFTPHARVLEPTSPLETDERRLLDKLTQVADIAMVRDAAADRRKRFMQRRSDDRRRTQPVTLEEIREADSLESVNTFRAEVLRKSSLNLFESELSEVGKPSLSIKKQKGQETFPQHVKHDRLKERRKDGSRYKTLPVTQTELNQITEGETLHITPASSSVKTLRQKLEEMERMDSNEDIHDSKGEATTDTKTESNKDGKLDISQDRKDSTDVSKGLESKKDSVKVSTETASVIKEPVSIHKSDNFSGMKSQLTRTSISSTVPQVKTVAMTTATTTTSTVATSSMVSRRISPSKLSKLDVGDDELDQLVEINYKEISSHKRKQKQALTESKRRDPGSTSLRQDKSANQSQDKFKSANQSQDKSSIVTSHPQKSVSQTVSEVPKSTTSTTATLQSAKPTAKVLSTVETTTQSKSVSAMPRAQTAEAISKTQVTETSSRTKVQPSVVSPKVQTVVATTKSDSVLAKAKTPSTMASAKVQSVPSVASTPKVQSSLQTISTGKSNEANLAVQSVKTIKKSPEALRRLPKQHETTKSQSVSQVQVETRRSGAEKIAGASMQPKGEPVVKKELPIIEHKQPEAPKVVSTTQKIQPHTSKDTSTAKQLSQKQPAERKLVTGVTVKQPESKKESQQASRTDSQATQQTSMTTVQKTPVKTQSPQETRSTVQKSVEIDKLKSAKKGVETSGREPEKRKVESTIQTQPMKMGPAADKQKGLATAKVMTTTKVQSDAKVISKSPQKPVDTSKVSSTLVTDVKSTVKVSANQKSEQGAKATVSATHKPAQDAASNQVAAKSVKEKAGLQIAATKTSANQKQVTDGKITDKDSTANQEVDSPANQKVDSPANQITDDRPGVILPLEKMAQGTSSLRITPPREDPNRLEGSPSVDRDISSDTEGAEDELSKMSVSDKLKLFKKLDKTAQLDQEAKQRRRFADRKKRFVRSQTLPVTEDEVCDVQEQKDNGNTLTMSAVNLEEVSLEIDDVSDKNKADVVTEDSTTVVKDTVVVNKDTAPVTKENVPVTKKDAVDTKKGVRRGSDIIGDLSRVKSVTEGEQVKKQSSDDSEESPKPEAEKEELTKEGEKEEEEKEEDSLSKLSIAEKVRLFSEIKEAESPQKRDTAVMRRKNRRLQSRFKTQSTDEPITSEEVEKARISPLAMSMVKPPDPEVLQILTIKDQREFMAQWAESTLSDVGSRAGSRPGSRPSSVILDEVKVSGDKRRTSMDEDSGAEDRKRKGILKSHEVATQEVRSILKQSPPSSDREVRGILKPDGVLSDGESDRKPASILKQDIVHAESEQGDHHSILKRDGIHEVDVRDHHSILKRDGTHEGDTRDHHSILKKDAGHQELRLESHSILKKDSIQLKKDSSGQMAATGESMHGILKKDSPPHELRQGGQGVRGVPGVRSILKKDSSFESKGEVGRRDSGAEVVISELEHVKTDLNANNETVDSESVISRRETANRGKLKKTSSFEMQLEHPAKSSQKNNSEVKTVTKTEISSSLSSKRDLEKSRSETGKVEKTKSVTKVTEDTDPVVTKVTSTTNKSTTVVDSRVRSRVKSDDDVTRTPVSTDLSSPLVSNLSRSRSARAAGRDSSTDDDSSTSSEKMSWIKNDAVARRRLRKMEEKGGSTPRSTNSAELEEKLIGRDENQENGHEKLHRPLEKSASSPEKSMTAEVALDPNVVKLRDSKSNKPRPRSIADRVTMLKDSQVGWKNKVEEKDQSKFTVEGKLNMAGLSPHPDSPYMARRLQGTPGKFPLKRAQSSPNLVLQMADSSDESESDTQQSTKVKVSKPDDEGFTEFFHSRPVEELNQDKVEVTVDDFNHVFIEANDILQTTKKLRPQRLHAGSRNPLKKLAERDDLQEEYEEVRTDVAERELRRIKREQIAGTAHIAQEALAGLASKENFSKVNLRKTDSFGSSTPGSSNLPYKEIMLLQVKGRRHCQTRLVAPVAHSINSGDCFLLVTSEHLYLWQGEYSNVIERSRAAELATNICQKRDLGCKTIHEPIMITEAKQTMTSSGQRFWEILGGLDEYQPPGPAEEDELYEMYMAECAKIYGMKGDDLIMLDSGYLPSYEMLNSKQTLVFDFGSEMYTWTGKHVAFNERKKALRLARLIWDKGYDYENCNINPLSPLCLESQGGEPVKADTRPDWALFAKVSENMETILFKEKFIDWPDAAKIIKVKGQDDDQDKEEAPELTPYEVGKMLPKDTSPITMVFEGSHVGRGRTWTEVHEGLRREYQIMTVGVEVFHILEYDHFKLDPASHGQFHDSDTYVIRWNFMISQTGMRNIRTQETRHSMTGRERWAYFFWQGRHSTITEKGASALMTVELDEERGPQVRVTQENEPPCFLQLFNSRMIIHTGKREDETTNTTGQWRLYVIRGELSNECYLMEVPCRMASLRSRTSMVLINVNTGIMQVWHGSKSASHTRQRAVSIGKALEKSCPPEVGLHDNKQLIMCEVNEGAEKSDFLVAMDTRERTYHYLMKDSTPQRHSPRLFYMHSVCGEFVATEILNTTRNHDNLCTAFPFSQSELYNASQPGLFLLDNHHEVYIWQGWWPEETEDVDNIRTGSAESRLNVDRRLAVETALNYCKEKNGDHVPKAWLVYAGLEPVRFTNLFPIWEVNEEAKASNLKERKNPNELIPLDKLLKKLTCTRYTFAELQEHPLPEGVDPLKMETYLDDTEFLEYVKMSKEEFYAMPGWKQNNVKKDVGLF